MICPVPGCTNGKHLFKKYNNYIAHFDRFHRRNIFIHSCPICKVKDARKSEIIRHFKRIHSTHVTPSLIGKLTGNNKFIYPGTFKKPRKRIHREERERAQLLRRQSLPSQPLIELSDNYNPREQHCTTLYANVQSYLLHSKPLYATVQSLTSIITNCTLLYHLFQEKISDF